ncbi:MAG: 3-oxoacyl-[acyl-carrier-protein] reductase [Pseudomonadota bacterium]|nr:3-oxoacyl-[acyl-carrier-protein] reductase [Pseudomonadota bacterium]QKK05952.1 MAG: 3-oxoacyl-[acyl-carrier-protein] reductase [Pseudomonadota bacterium]
MFDLTGKKALVTGASGGIGGAIAKRLAQQGADVVITGRKPEPLYALAEEIGDKAHVIVSALDDSEKAAALIAGATEAMGGVDILVNNAGFTRDTLSMRMTDGDWDAVIQVNLTACFQLCRAAMRGMMKNRWGRMINISSVVGVTGNPGQANYVASKAGMIGMTKSIAAELASRNITANCIAPGFIATPMTDALTDDQKAGINAKIPAGRMGTPDDIGHAVVYLASDEAAYMTGQTLHVNGGMAMI